MRRRTFIKATAATLGTSAFPFISRTHAQLNVDRSQLTKTRVRTGLGSGDDIPDLHRVIGYDHSVDQQLYQFAPLFERSMFESAGQLLEDLELTLVDIVQLSPASGAQDRQMIEKSLDQGHVLTRLRSAIPAGMQKGS